MLIIGERINTSREEIKRAVEAKDKDFIKRQARMQIEAGAHVIDVNCGTSLEREPEDMEWLVKTLQEDSPIRLSIDSPSPHVIEKALQSHRGTAIINSISCEKARYEKILPLAKKFDCEVIALTIDERGIPKKASERFEISTIIVEIAARYGVSKNKIYFDPLVKPVSTDQTQPKEFLESLGLIKELGYKTVGGISNVSFGLPERSLINRTFLAMAVACGLDAVIIDPLDKFVMQTILGSESVLGLDQYSANYIQAFRQGKLSHSPLGL